MSATDVPRVVDKPLYDWKDPEGNRVKGDAVMAAEPKRRKAIVRDADRHLWQRGNTRWTCLTPVGTRGVTQVGRLPWSALVDMYGPITVIDDKEKRRRA